MRQKIATSEARREVVVVGGGPAGATAARLLALWGHQVLVLTREHPARDIAESLPPSCRSLYRHLGIESTIDGAGFQPTTGNTVWWGEAAPRVERFPGGASGHQVSSVHLERVLLALAEAAGVEVRHGGPIRDVLDLESEQARVVVGDPEGTVAARWVLDASGRAGVLGRRWRRRVESAATLALTARYRSSDWRLEDPTHTLVESYEDGWAWSVPVSATERFAAVMVDPRRTALARRADREALFAIELAKTTHLAPRFAGARRDGGVRACDASPYTSKRFGGRGFLLLGDAASFIDPLSSYGVKKAMASGWLAAVCVNTSLRRPELEPHALELYTRRERQVFDSYSRQSADFSRLAGDQHASEFWSARAHIGDGSADEAELDPRRLREDPSVRASFDRIRRSRRLAVERAPGVGIVQRPIVSGREIVLADHLVCAWAPEGIRYLQGVDLTLLVALAPRVRSVAELLEAYARAGATTTPPELLAALAVCVAKGILSQDRDTLTPSVSD